MYYLIRTDNGEYAYNSISPKYRGRISSGIYDTSEDFGYWYYFKQGNQEGKYTIHSYKTGKAVTENTGKLYVNKDTEAAEFTISLNEQGEGFTISSEAGAWLTKTGTIDLIELSTEMHTTWKLQFIRTVDITDNSVPHTTINTEELITVYCHNGIIIINGVAEGEEISVYNAVGHLITTATATGRSTAIETGLNEGNIAFVVVGKHNAKVLVR